MCVVVLCRLCWQEDCDIWKSKFSFHISIKNGILYLPYSMGDWLWQRTDYELLYVDVLLLLCSEDEVLTSVDSHRTFKGHKMKLEGRMRAMLETVWRHGHDEYLTLAVKVKLCIMCLVKPIKKYCRNYFMSLYSGKTSCQNVLHILFKQTFIHYFALRRKDHLCPCLPLSLSLSHVLFPLSFISLLSLCRKKGCLSLLFRCYANTDV